MQKAGEIVLLQDGKNIQEGDHASLLGSNGLYAKMVNPLTLSLGDSSENEGTITCPDWRTSI